MGQACPRWDRAVAALGQVQWCSHISAFEGSVCQACGGTQRFLTCRPIQVVQRRQVSAPAPPGLFLNFTLISSSPRGKQRPNLRAGKGWWRVPSLLPGWCVSRQGRTPIPPSRCSQGWRAHSPTPAAAPPGPGDPIRERCWGSAQSGDGSFQFQHHG